MTVLYTEFWGKCCLAPVAEKASGLWISCRNTAGDSSSFSLPIFMSRGSRSGTLPGLDRTKSISHVQYTHMWSPHLRMEGAGEGRQRLIRIIAKLLTPDLVHPLPTASALPASSCHPFSAFPTAGVILLRAVSPVCVQNPNTGLNKPRG